MKKTFIVISEIGRVKNKISGRIFQIKNNMPNFITDFEYYNQSTPGLEHEAATALIKAGILPKDRINSSRIIDHQKRDFTFFVVESRGLNYTRIY